MCLQGVIAAGAAGGSSAAGLQLFGSAVSAMGSIQAGQAEKRRQAAIAQQYEQNAKMEKLKALQEHNKRVQSLNAFQSAANVARAFNNRAASDRSFQAIQKASVKESDEDMRRARLQSLSAQQRMRFAAADARFSGSMAAQQGIVSAFGTIGTGIYRYSQITPPSSDSDIG
jgi:hypothetical protein